MSTHTERMNWIDRELEKKHREIELAYCDFVCSRLHAGAHPDHIERSIMGALFAHAEAYGFDVCQRDGCEGWVRMGERCPVCDLVRA